MEGIRWMVNKTNEEVLKIVEEERNNTKIIENRRRKM